MNLETLLEDEPKFLCYGKFPGSTIPSREVLQYLYKNVDETMVCLETGCGHTTVVFAMRSREHYCIDPNHDAIGRVKEYLNKRDIPLDKVNFIVEGSQFVLPRLDESIRFDVVLIDGCHAFPFPYIDWYYAKRHLVTGGLMVIDDIQLKTCRILYEFLVSEPTWRYVCRIGNTAIFRKLWDSADNENWILQPFNTFPIYLQNTSGWKLLSILFRKGASRVKSLIRIKRGG